MPATLLDRSTEPLPFDRGAAFSAEAPVAYEDGKVVLDPKSMAARKPYVFDFQDHLMFAIKWEDGTVDLYEIAIEDQQGA